MPNNIDIKALVEFLPVNRPIVKTGEMHFSYEPEAKTYINGVQNIGTTEEALELGDVASAGLVIVINRATANFVEIGLTASYSIKLLPGQFCIFPPAGTIFARSNTAASDVEFWVFPAKASS